MIEIIVPNVSHDAVSTGLRELTKAIVKKGGEQVHGLLGGEYGYGAHFENNIFRMDPFCWCEKDDCPLCNETKPNFEHKSSGVGVIWYKYIGRGMEFRGEGDWSTILAECIASV